MARQVAIENNLFNGLFDPPTHTADPAGAGVELARAAQAAPTSDPPSATR